jgi:hypothetical protein
MNAEEKRRKALDDYLAESALRMMREMGYEGVSNFNQDEYDEWVAQRAIAELERKFCGPTPPTD